MAWLSGYNYRKSITLSRASGAVSNYQMKLLLGESSGATGEDVDCGGKCLSTFNDLRFTKADGITLLDYWIESISGTTPNQLATVWIEFDSIGTSATTFYMYYGNQAATAASNAEATFPFFYDFSDAVLDSSKWDLIKGDIGIDQSHLVLTGTSGTRGNIMSKSAFSKPIRVASKVQCSGNITDSAHVLTLTNDALTHYSFVYTSDAANKIMLQRKNGTTDPGVVAVSITDLTAENIFEQFWSNDEIKFLCNGSVLNTFSTYLPTEDMKLYLKEGIATGTTVSIDWIYVAKYANPEPAWGAWGTMEEWAGITTETATATDTFDGGSLSYATSESAEATATFDGDSLRDFTSESAEATDTFGNERTAYGLTTESAEATDTMGALHLVDATTESASASDSMEAEDLIRKKIKFPNLQGKHLSLKFESATSGSFAIYYLRHKMFKTRELTSDQKHPNTQGSHIGIKLSNSGSDEFILMYVSEKMQLVTT